MRLPYRKRQQGCTQSKVHESLNETMLAMRRGLDILRAMTREAAAEIFERIALLLELKGENPFKTRAYKMGAEVVENHA